MQKGADTSIWEKVNMGTLWVLLIVVNWVAGKLKNLVFRKKEAGTWKRGAEEEKSNYIFLVAAP